MPVTASPYFGSASSIECPPRIATPASAATAPPPRRISSSTSLAELVERERDQVERADRRRAHRVDVGQGVGGRDPAEVERVIDDRGEEVDGLDERQVVAEREHAGVVGAAEADQHVRGRRRPAEAARAAGRSRRPAACSRIRRRGRARSAARATTPMIVHRAGTHLHRRELDAAIAAITEPGRLQRGPGLVTRAAPSLQRVLAQRAARGRLVRRAATSRRCARRAGRTIRASACGPCGRWSPRRPGWGCSSGWRLASSWPANSTRAAQPVRPPQTQEIDPMEIRFLGHACFTLSDGDTTVLIDPFLTGNPKAADQRRRGRARRRSCSPTATATTSATRSTIAKRTGRRWWRSSSSRTRSARRALTSTTPTSAGR